MDSSFPREFIILQLLRVLGARILKLKGLLMTARTSLRASYAKLLLHRTAIESKELFTDDRIQGTFIQIQC